MSVHWFTRRGLWSAGYDAHREIEVLLKEYTHRAAEVASLAAELLAHKKLLEQSDAMGSHGLLPDPTTKKVNTTGDRGIPARVSIVYSEGQ